jgi:hypothetical protein
MRRPGIRLEQLALGLEALAAGAVFGGIVISLLIPVATAGGYLP